MTTELKIISITISEELLKKVEDFQFGNRISSRSQAFDRLLTAAFEQKQQEEVIEYVSFEEAITALKEGKMIRKKNDNAWYSVDSVLEYSFGKWVQEFIDNDEWVIKEVK